MIGNVVQLLAPGNSRSNIHIVTGDIMIAKYILTIEFLQSLSTLSMTGSSSYSVFDTPIYDK